MIGITHLVVNGCSFTYCQGLDNPKEQGWPTLLANKLKVPVVNLAIKGSGNDAIHRRTYEYFFEDLPNNSKPLYIIAWSQYWRREIWNKKYYDNKDGYVGINLTSFIPKNHAEYSLLDNWSEEDFHRKTILYRLSLDSLFKSKHIPYLSSFFTDVENITPSLVHKFPNSLAYLNKTPITNPFFDKIIAPYPTLPCGHHGPEAQIALADFIYNYLINEYGEITPLNGKFMTLLEYSKINANTDIFINPSWI
jgi:hypothetical protein